MGIGGALLAFPVMLVGISVARGTTDAAVEAVVMRAMKAEHELGTLPASASASGVGATLRGAMIISARAVLASVYSGPILDQRLETVIGGIELEGTQDGIFIWDGGVKDVAFQSTLIDGDLAVVKVRATSYLVISATTTSERATPQNRADLTFELSRIGGAWYVTSEKLEFLPGESP